MIQNSTLIPQFEVPPGYMYTIKKINNKQSFATPGEVKTYINECFLAGDTIGDIIETVYQHNDKGLECLKTIVNKQQNI